MAELDNTLPEQEKNRLGRAGVQWDSAQITRREAVEDYVRRSGSDSRCAASAVYRCTFGRLPLALLSLADDLASTALPGCVE
jgi:hypothetical protein